MNKLYLILSCLAGLGFIYWLIRKNPKTSPAVVEQVEIPAQPVHEVGEEEAPEIDLSKIQNPDSDKPFASIGSRKALKETTMDSETSTEKKAPKKRKTKSD
jgi:hypothetical protein